MTCIADLLAPAHSRIPVGVHSPAIILVHLAKPKRRALIQSIGYQDVPEGYLRALYGPSWGDVQPALRALVSAGIIISSGMGRDVHYSLDLSAFPAQMLEGLLRGASIERIAA